MSLLAPQHRPRFAERTGLYHVTTAVTLMLSGCVNYSRENIVKTVNTTPAPTVSIKEEPDAVPNVADASAGETELAVPNDEEILNEELAMETEEQDDENDEATRETMEEFSLMNDVDPDTAITHLFRQRFPELTVNGHGIAEVWETKNEPHSIEVRSVPQGAKWQPKDPDNDFNVVHVSRKIPKKIRIVIRLVNGECFVSTLNLETPQDMFAIVLKGSASQPQLRALKPCRLVP